jgi:hypothetical protein
MLGSCPKNRNQPRPPHKKPARMEARTGKNLRSVLLDRYRITPPRLWGNIPEVFPMTNPFNRTQRRKLRACAKTYAPLLAQTCLNFDTHTGRTTVVEDPLAVAVLERAFNRLLIEGGQIQTLALTEEVARTFPAYDPGRILPGAKPWLAVGLDIDGRGTFTLRHILVPFARDPMIERRVVERTLEAELAPHLARSGWGKTEARA